MIIDNSRIDKINFEGEVFYIKRDDLLSVDFSGNKARKFDYFLSHPPKGVTKILSYGSNQSNAMYSLSVLAKKLGLEFIYICHHVGDFLAQNPIGNYKYALQNDMKLIIDENPEQKCLELKDEKTLYIKEGGAIKEASFGIKKLADELKGWVGDKRYDIFLPSGTGTTALYLQQYLDLKVFTCPCVGDEKYLKKQFDILEPKKHPIILNPLKKYHFGKIKKELYGIYEKILRETKIEFDLLYDPVGWITLLDNKSAFKNPIIYIHQGGVLGNASLIERYKYKGFA